MSASAYIALGIIGLIFAAKQGWLDKFATVQSDETPDDPSPDPSPLPVDVDRPLEELRAAFVSSRDEARHAEERFIKATNRYESALVQAEVRVDKELADLRAEFHDKKPATEPDKKSDESPD